MGFEPTYPSSNVFASQRGAAYLCEIRIIQSRSIARNFSVFIWMSIPVKPSASCHTIRRPLRDLERGERPDCSTPALFSVQISERDERKTLSNWREGISSVNYGQTRKRGFQKKTTHHRIHEKAVITRARKAADLNPQLFRGILKFILVVLVRGDLQSFAKNSKLMKNQKRSVES